jgi:hypothetical protein
MKNFILGFTAVFFCLSTQATTFTVTNTANAGAGSFRQAILDANALAGTDNITFAIGTGAQTITLSSSVNVTTPMYIDGTTQPGYTGAPLITIGGVSKFNITTVNTGTLSSLAFISNLGSTAINVSNSSNWLFVNNRATGMMYALQLQMNNTTHTITANNFSGSANGIYMNGGFNDGITISNNNLSNCTNRALYYNLGTPASINTNTFTGSGNVLYLKGATNFTLSPPGSGGLNENVFGTGTIGGLQIELEACNGVNVSGFNFNSQAITPSNGLVPFMVTNCSNCNFSNNTSTGMMYGFKLQGHNSTNTITANNFSGSDNGIYMFGGTNNSNTINNNNLSNCRVYALYYNSGTPTSINTNTFTGSANALYLKSATNFTLGSANVFKNQTATSIQLESCSAVNVSNNALKGTGGNGILINQSNNCVINGNTTCGRTFGVRIQGSSNANTISNGSFVSCGTGIQLDNTSVNNTTITAVNLFNTTNITNGGANTVITATTSTNTSPIVSVNSGSICSGSSFTMSPSGAPTYSYTGGSAVVSPTTTTSYSVVGMDANGCISAVPAVSGVTVNSLPNVTVNSGAICAGQSFTMVPAGADTYTYSSGSAVVSPTSNASYNVSGTNTVTGCASNVDAVSSVTVNALPTITVSSGTICAGQSFTIITNGASTYTSIPALTGPVVTPTATIDYSVTGTDANGCVSSNTAVATVSINVLPSISVNSGSICAGQSFTMVPSGADTYTYSNGSSVATPIANATYSVSGTDANGCVSSTDAVSSVTVNALPTISVNSGAICAGQSFTMVPSGAATYTYSNGTDIVTPSVDATYSVSGTDANGCVSNVDAISTVTVNALPTLVAVTNNTLLCTGETATLTVSGTATTYTWSTTDNTTAIAVTPTVQTTYTVNGTNGNGCVNSTTVTQDVSLCTGIVTLSNSNGSINVYPNPNNGLFVLELTTVSKVTVTNALGQVVISETFEAGKHSLDINNETTGVYFVKVMENNNQQIIKVIKQ